MYIQTHIHTYIHSGVFSTLKKREILTFATPWIELDGIILSEISQTQKDKYCMISLVRGILNGPTYSNRE